MSSPTQMPMFFTWNKCCADDRSPLNVRRQMNMLCLAHDINEAFNLGWKDAPCPETGSDSPKINKKMFDELEAFVAKAFAVADTQMQIMLRTNPSDELPSYLTQFDILVYAKELEKYKDILIEKPSDHLVPENPLKNAKLMDNITALPGSPKRVSTGSLQPPTVKRQRLERKNSHKQGVY